MQNNVRVATGFLLGSFDFYVLIDQAMKMKIFIQDWPQEQVKDVPVSEKNPVLNQRHQMNMSTLRILKFWKQINNLCTEKTRFLNSMYLIFLSILFFH